MRKKKDKGLDQLFENLDVPFTRSPLCPKNFSAQARDGLEEWVGAYSIREATNVMTLLFPEQVKNLQAEMLEAYRANDPTGLVFAAGLQVLVEQCASGEKIDQDAWWAKALEAARGQLRKEDFSTAVFKAYIDAISSSLVVYTVVLWVINYAKDLMDTYTKQAEPFDARAMYKKLRDEFKVSSASVSTVRKVCDDMAEEMSNHIGVFHDCLAEQDGSDEAREKFDRLMEAFIDREMGVLAAIIRADRDYGGGPKAAEAMMRDYVQLDLTGKAQLFWDMLLYSSWAGGLEDAEVQRVLRGWITAAEAALGAVTGLRVQIGRRA